MGIYANNHQQCYRNDLVMSSDKPANQMQPTFLTKMFRSQDNSHPLPKNSSRSSRVLSASSRWAVTYRYVRDEAAATRATTIGAEDPHRPDACTTPREAEARLASSFRITSEAIVGITITREAL